MHIHVRFDGFKVARKNAYETIQIMVWYFKFQLFGKPNRAENSNTLDMRFYNIYFLASSSKLFVPNNSE